MGGGGGGAVKTPGVFQHGRLLLRAALSAGVWRGECSKYVTQYSHLTEGAALTDAPRSAKQQRGEEQLLTGLCAYANSTSSALPRGAAQSD